MYEQVKRRPRFYYPAVTSCIYCRAEKALTDEHIVPFALGGNMILPNGSCTDCADTIKRYEQRALRATLGQVRIRHNFPTRKKNQRPKFVEIGTRDDDGAEEKMFVPAAEHPFGAALPHFGRAGIFVGSTPTMDILTHTLKSVYLSGDLDKFKEKYGWDGKYKIHYHPIEFGQMIIKMSYCFAIAELGIDSFEPICLPQILSTNLNISYIFGQSGMNEAVEGESAVWDMEIAYLIRNPFILVVVYCSLFPKGGTPIYEVVLGKIKSSDQFDLLRNYIRDGRFKNLAIEGA